MKYHTFQNPNDNQIAINLELFPFISKGLSCNKEATIEFECTNGKVCTQIFKTEKERDDTFNNIIFGTQNNVNESTIIEEEKMKKLYEVKHDYYCENDNYHSNEYNFHYKNWKDFIESMGNLEDHNNLIFRWDWNIENDRKDENYRDGVLSLYYINQRKGLFVSRHIDVCKNDENLIREFLHKKFNYLIKLWEPFK